MSLINDALKKAQKQRTGEAPSLGSLPSVGGESPHRIAKRSKPAGFDTLVMRAGIGAGVVLALAVGGFFLLRDKPQPAPVGPPLAGVPSPSSPTSATASAPSSPLPAQSSAVTPPPAPTFTLPTAPAAAPGGPVSAPAASSNVGGTSRPDASIASAPAPKIQAQQPTANNQQPAPAPAPVVERPKLEPRAIEYIENIKVAGIRASATDAKVLMNDRVYRPGSLVSAEFGLKLVDITADSLTFEDDKGGRYTRTF